MRRKWVLGVSMAAAVAISGMALTERAQAAVAAAPGALQGAVQTLNLAEEVRYVCRRVRRCGRYGCTWRRACFWRPNRYYRRY